MTNQEFVDSFSPKAKEIISNYQCNSNNKRKIIVYLNDTVTRVNMDHPDAYIFEIKKEESFYDMEYSFLHEFYHCVQRDSWFPYICQTDIKYKKLSSFLSSIVLDCDVYNRLLNFGYKENPNILHSELNNIHDTLFVISKENQFSNYLNDVENQIFYAGKIVLISKFCNDKYNINKLIDFTKIYFPIIYKDYKIIIDALKRFGFSSPKNVRKIFKTVIRELKIDEFVTIV